MKAGAGTMLKIARDAGGGDYDYGERGTIGPDGLDLDLSGRDACGNGSDGDGGEDGRMGLEPTPGPLRKSRETLMALTKLLPQLRPFDQALVEM